MEFMEHLEAALGHIIKAKRLGGPIVHRVDVEAGLDWAQVTCEGEVNASIYKDLADRIEDHDSDAVAEGMIEDCTEALKESLREVQGRIERLEQQLNSVRQAIKGGGRLVPDGLTALALAAEETSPPLQSP